MRLAPSSTPSEGRAKIVGKMRILKKSIECSRFLHSQLQKMTDELKKQPSDTEPTSMK